jgi:hypothetical protein
MDAITLTQKHLQERIDLENLQATEREAMLKRHKNETLEAKGKYFEDKRQEQRQKLLDDHQNELAELFAVHQHEWEQFRQVKEIIRDSKQLSFDLQPETPRKDLSFRNKDEEEPPSKFELLKKRLLQKHQRRKHEPDI